MSAGGTFTVTASSTLRDVYAQEWRSVRRAIRILHREGEYVAAAILRDSLRETEKMIPHLRTRPSKPTEVVK